MALMIETISPDELQKMVQSGQPVELLDVRTPAEYQATHAEPARNVPLETLDPQAVMANRTGSADDALYLICESGKRAESAYTKFIELGFTQVVSVEGGTAAWKSAGLPIVEGKKTISLERQVRIAAGSFVVAGVLLSLAIHPVFIWLSAFIGAGLMYAGVTDSCGMAMMLAKMPWNQSGAS